ncbi:unnamed protein product [marine sediment metagenome]|uniref:Uncharacterized protein n=1 Tax=marine sediment metagenome TaxID=412755 RepID=X0VC88_9ZZZZ
MEVKEFKGKFMPEKLSEEKKAKAFEQIKKLRKRGEKMVKGKFSFINAPGGMFEFGYKFFKGEPVRRISITDGEICDVPLEVAIHLNNIVLKIPVVDINMQIPYSKRFPGFKKYRKESRVSFVPSEYETDSLKALFAE